MGAVPLVSPAVVAKLASHTPDGGPLTASELEIVRTLHAGALTFRHGHPIVSQGRGCAGIWLLADGFAIRYKILSDGRRQMFHVAMPGEMLGYPACFFEKCLYSVTMLTDGRACPVSFEDLTRIFESSPRLAMALFWSSAVETAMYAERLAAIGRLDAPERVARFILEMAFRLQAVGVGDGVSFDMPLTQEQMADVLGLSTPHVNRMLRQLREQGMIEIAESHIRVLDRAELTRFADFDESFFTTTRIAPSDAVHGRRSGPPHR